MSGGRLVVLDRLGRDVKAYPLSAGLATIGSGAACDIRVLLPTVSPHHATVVVQPNQTVVSSITAGETLVNGVGVSVCVLRHGDRLGVGGRTLRWEYDQPRALPGSPRAPARTRARTRRRSPLAPQRASVPASSAKQVAIVQPQRRHTTNDQNDSPQASSSAGSSRSRGSRHGDAPEDVDNTNRKSTARASPKNGSLSDTTKASLWIESRKTPRGLPRAPPRALPRSAPRAARKSTPLRLAVLRKAQSAHKLRVTKIQAPSKIDHTKQAAIMLMAGHTPKPKPTPKRPSFVVKKPSPVRSRALGGDVPGLTPERARPRAAQRGSERTPDKSVSDLQSPILPKPRKSALKKSSKKSTRKTESIKFDLSNLENPEDRPSDVVLLEDAAKDCEDDFVSEEDISLRYSDSSRSPSPKRSIQSRSSRILESSLGETYVQNLSSDRSANLDSPRSKNTSVLDSPRQRKSSRGSLIVEKALDSSFENASVSPSSRRTTKSLTDQSYSTTFASTRKTMTRSPRSNKQNLESYSIVDLVSMDSVGSDRSVYGSAGSETSTTFATPRPGRSTRANNSSLLSSSTPYADKTKQSSKTVSPILRSRTTSPQVSNKSKNSTLLKRRSASLTTPENTQTRLTINSTRISRASRSRSRINDSDILLMDDDEASPRSSRRISKSSLSTPIPRKTITITDTPESAHNGTSTPENTHSPEEATTPVLSIQNFLEQSSLSQSSLSSQRSQRRRGANFKRKTIGGDHPETKKPRSSFKSRSLVATSRRSLRATTSSVEHMDLSLNASNDTYQDEEVTTPKSAVLPIPEGVKNKHSTAKKTQSKRYIIDNLDESNFVKQLFNSPVKRKLSQSMTEFSRKKLFEDDDDVRRPTRNTIALTGRTPDNSFMERTENFTPDVFVSPMSTPGKSPNTTGLERQFDNTPETNRRNVRGVNNSLLSRRSIKNDLTDVAGVKRVFGRSPRNRLSDVRVKEVFASSPKNDLRRVTGVKTLFRSVRKQKSPKNTLEDVRGVKELFRNKKSVSNDLRNVSGVKSALRVNSPRNDLSDVRGLRQLYRESPKNNLSDVSGVEELFNVSQDSQDSSFDDLIGHTHENQDLNTTFDQLLGKPTLRAYTKPRSFTKVVKPKQKRNAKSLNDSISMITENVEEWLQNELKKRVNKDKSTNKSNLTRELQKLTTDTVEGNAPIMLSRSRNSTITRSVNAENQERKKSASEIYSIHTLPIKKRSLVEANKRSQLEVLPLKKRRVVHSTPVKGRVSVTMNASELSRVSPIANVTAVGKIDELLHRELSKMTRTKITLTDDLSLEMATTKVLVPEMVQKKPSPKRVSPKKQSQKQVRATRSNRRGSLVITKKKPILSPKPNIEKPKRPTNDGNIEVIPTRNRPARQIKVDDKLKTKKNTRAKRATATETQNQVLQSEAESEEEKVEKITKGKSIIKEPPKTPKNTRARAIKMTVVVTKPSPQLKPKRNLNSKVNDPKVIKSETRTRQRKQDIENIPDLTTEQKQSRRTRNAKNVTDAKPTNEKPEAKPVKQDITKVQDVKSKPNQRGKHVTFEAEPPKEAATKRVGASKSVITEDIKADTTRRRNVKDSIETATFKPKTRKQQSKIAVTEKNTESSIDEVGTKARRGAKSKNVTFKEDIPPNKRGKSVQNQNDSKVTRSKKSAKDTVQADKKSSDPVITDKEEAPKRGNKKAEEKTEFESARRTTRKAQSENTIGVQNVLEDNKEKTVGRITRKATISKSEEIVKEDKNNIPENKKEVVVGKKTRNVQKSNVNGKGDEKVVLEDKMEVETSSRGRRNKNVAQEVSVENAKGKKTTAPVKEAPKRGGRMKKAELVPADEEVQPEVATTSKSARRKRKVDVDETAIKEAPAKRLRTTRAAAAALVEPVVASGRSRRR